MRDSDFLLSPAELRLRRQKRRRLALSAGGAVLLVVLLGLSARPAAHAIKAWQARRHAQKAVQFIGQEKWKEAREEASAALQLSRNEPEALRAVAQFLSLTRQPGALEFWKELAAHRPLTRQDLRDEAAAALAAANTAVAGAAVKELTSERDGGPIVADWLLAAQLAVQTNAPDTAAADLAKVVSDHRSTKRQLLQASGLQVALPQSGNAVAQAAQDAAWKRIRDLARERDAVGLDALTLLAQRELNRTPENSKADTAKPDGTAAVPLTNDKGSITAPQLAEALESHPLAKTLQQLLAVDLWIHAAPLEKRKLVAEAVARWRNSDNQALAALATWLNGKGEFQLELDTIPLERSLLTRDLFLQHVDALGALGRWAEIKRLLESERFPLDPTVSNMYLARCNAQLGEKIASENNWHRALKSANGDFGKLMTLADYASKNGANAVADAACDGALAVEPKARAAWQEKLQLAQRTRDTGRIHAVMERMLRSWPNDFAIENDEAYLRLLLAATPDYGNRSAESQAAQTMAGNADGGLASPAQPSDFGSQLIDIEHVAQRLVAEEPTSLPHRTLLALVYLKENRPATALGVYEKLNIAAGALTPSALAVHAAVLAANGNTADAAKEASQIPRSVLLPEEAGLISNL